MTQVVTPSNITSGQIGKLQELLGAALRKSGLPSEPVQHVIEGHGDTLVTEMVTAIRKRVEAMSNIIVRRVKVDRIRTPHEALKATGRNLYVTDSVVKTMPIRPSPTSVQTAHTGRTRTASGVTPPSTAGTVSAACSWTATTSTGAAVGSSRASASSTLNLVLALVLWTLAFGSGGNIGAVLYTDEWY